MKTRLIFVRHGYSEANQANIFAGQTDASLTQIGFLQAKRAAEYLQSIKIDKIYASPLSRAFNTGSEIAKLQNLDIIPDSGLSEINGGDWENQPFDTLTSISKKAYFDWKNNFYECKCPGGESVKDFFKRISKCVTKIAESNPGSSICIATHATPIRVISCLALGLNPSQIQDVPWSPNASINIVDFEDGRFTFIKQNITEHLKDIETNLPSNV